MRITADKLRELGACAGDIEAFEKQWPDGCEVTRENCDIAFGRKGLGMHVHWAASRLLSRKAYDEYGEAVNDMHAACEAVDTILCKCWESTIELFYQAAKEATP